jgi:hypothetical protein
MGVLVAFDPTDISAFARPTDARDLTPDQQLDELSAILAIGFRRVLALHARPDLLAQEPADPALVESSANCLDLSAEARLHVSRVVNTSGDRERSCK